MDIHTIGKGIDDPVQIMFWDPMEFVIAITLLGFGMLSGLFVVGAILAVGTLMGARKLKRGAKRGAVQHFLWHVGISVDPLLRKRYPPAWKNEFLE